MATVNEDKVWGELCCNVDCPNGNVTVKVKGEKFVIGRSQDCDLRVGQKWISGHHCYLECSSDGVITLHDTSINGTFVNKIRIRNGKSQELKNGDVIHLALLSNSSSAENHYVFRAPVEDEESVDLNCTQEFEGDEICVSDSPEPQVKKLKTDLGDAVSGSNTLDKAHSTDVPESDSSVPKRDDNSDNKNAVSAAAVAAALAKIEKDAARNSKRDPLEEALLCGFCLAILHDPISLQPCMHCFCAGCYSSWMNKSKTCPQCRKHVKCIGRNYVIKNTIEAYLKQFPEKSRTPDELELLDSQNKITADMLNVSHDQDKCSYDYDSQTDDEGETDYGESYNSDSDIPALTVAFPFGPPTNVVTCRQCPNNKEAKSYACSVSASQSVSNKNGSTAFSADTSTPSCSSSSNSDVQGAASVPPFVCSPNQHHVTCYCCWEPMPAQYAITTCKPGSRDTVPPQKCSNCHHNFCHMYWGCRRPGCFGCLNEFSEINFGDKCMKRIINENVIESAILEDYLKSKGKSWKNLLKECLAKLNEGTYHCSTSMTSKRVLCYTCGLKYFRELAYQYRCTIPMDELPESATNREDCYWGKNCRTQKHKESHAQHFNHICEQTKFF